VLRKPGNLDLKIFSDASYGDKGETSRSQTGVLTTLGEQPIGWYSRRQDVVALSITEAKYIANCEGAKDSSWTSQFLAELKVPSERTPELWTDSEGAAYLSLTTKFLRWSHHIEHRFHYIRQEVAKNKLVVKAITEKDNPLDILTKITSMSTVNAWKRRWIKPIG